MGVKWHDARFTPRSAAIETACLECGRPMWLPKSKVAMYKRCGPACNAAWRRKKLGARDRPCEICGKQFRPRPVQLTRGHGRYCSQACNPTDHLITPEALASAQQAKRDGIAAGRVTYPTGESNKRWLGGRKAAVARRIASGKSAAHGRKWRSENPDKARGYAKRRRLKVAGTLATGTIEHIGTMQRWRCAICRVSIRAKYQLDHITPLSRGGPHEARNIQLLCGPCNMKKNAKDPITYMREVGRLL